MAAGPISGSHWGPGGGALTIIFRNSISKLLAIRVHLYINPIRTRGGGGCIRMAIIITCDDRDLSTSQGLQLYMFLYLVRRGGECPKAGPNVDAFTTVRNAFGCTKPSALALCETVVNRNLVNRDITHSEKVVGASAPVHLWSSLHTRRQRAHAPGLVWGHVRCVYSERAVTVP